MDEVKAQLGNAIDIVLDKKEREVQKERLELLRFALDRTLFTDLEKVREMFTKWEQSAEEYMKCR